MKKTIWIVNQYASTPETGFGGRHYYFAKELAKRGLNVYLIASSSHHSLRQKPEFRGRFKTELIDGFTFVWVKTPKYSEARSLQRLANWFLFSWFIQKLTKKDLFPPDTVLVSSPSLISFLGGERIARQYKARLIFDVRDIWPLSLQELGGHSALHPFIAFLQWLEDRAYRNSDAVISNLKNSIEHMAIRGMDRDKFTWIPNGFSVEEVASPAELPAHIESQIPKNKFVVGYAGTLGAANELYTLIDAAEKLREREDIEFVIVGGGSEERALKNAVIAKRLSNVQFIQPIAKIQVQNMLRRFDACYIGWLDKKLYHFGIAANKIPEYLYSEKPIIHAYSGFSDPIVEHNAGLTVKARDVNALVNVILKLKEMTPEERIAMGRNGRAAALEHYEYGRLSQRLLEVISR